MAIAIDTSLGPLPFLAGSKISAISGGVGDLDPALVDGMEGYLPSIDAALLVHLHP